MAGVRLTAGGRHRHPVAIMMAVNEIMVVLNTVLFFMHFLLHKWTIGGVVVYRGQYA